MPNQPSPLSVHQVEHGVDWGSVGAGAATGAVSGAAAGPWGAAAGAAIGAGASIYGSKQQSRAAQAGTNAESTATRQALLFQQQQAAENRRQFDLTQKQNLDLANRDRQDLLNEQTYQHDQTTQRQQRVAPYTGLGLGALAQLRNPIYGPSGGSNTLANLMQRRG